MHMTMDSLSMLMNKGNYARVHYTLGATVGEQVCYSVSRGCVLYLCPRLITLSIWYHLELNLVV